MRPQIKQTQPTDRFWSFIERYSPQTVRYMAYPNDRGDYRCFVAVDEDDTFAGLCIIDIHALGFGPLAAQFVACLENILVADERRRQGIGSALLHKALTSAWETGAAHAWWSVDYDNTGAIGFYQANGAVFVANEDPDADEPERYYTAVIPNPRLQPNPNAPQANPGSGGGLPS